MLGEPPGRLALSLAATKRHRMLMAERNRKIAKLLFLDQVREGFFYKIIRMSIRVILGFDFLHAWRNRDKIYAADIIWTHTESQFLSVAALLFLRRNKPKIIGQAVWLFDQWPKLTPLHKILFRLLISRIDVITTHSPLNAQAARSIFPRARVEIIRFGIPSEHRISPVTRSTHPIQVISVGNDRHRDWGTLVKALGGHKGISVEILSGTAPRSVTNNVNNISVWQARNNSDLDQAYARASVAVVPLLPNLHASGITVIQEAILAGVPVIATDTGGLRSYFTEDEITFIPVKDADALRSAVLKVCSDYSIYLQKTVRAQKEFSESKLGANRFIVDHLNLSKELLS